MTTDSENADRPGVSGNPAGKKPSTRRRGSSPASPRKLKAGNAKDVAAVAKAETTENKLKEARFRAQTATHPSVNAALVIEKFGDHFGDLDVAALAVHLKDAMNDISKNDLSSCEAMLYSQAQALQMIFVSAALQVPDQNWFSNSEAYLRMALKAQSQCRATLETLAQIKNPQPVAFVEQANIAHGPQQVNNGMMPAVEPRGGRENRKCAKQTIRG
jgi:hypothetical protein